MQKDAPNHDDEDLQCVSTSVQWYICNYLGINGDYLGTL